MATTVYSINEVLDELHSILSTDLTDAGLTNGGYDYRTSPLIFRRTYMLHFASGMPNHNMTAAGGNPYYDIGIVLFAKHEKSEASLREAERDLNDMENAVYEILDSVKDTPANPRPWFKIDAVYPSIRPLKNQEMSETRIGEIPLRFFINAK